MSIKSYDMGFHPSFDTVVSVDSRHRDLRSLLDGTITGEYIDVGVTCLQLGAFAGCKSLTKIYLPNCTEILGRYAFDNCESVTTLELPNLTRITDATYTFQGMSKLQSIDLSKLTEVDGFAGVFYNCTKIKKIDLRSLGGTSFGNYVFRYCFKLETLILGGTTINTMTNKNVLIDAGANAPNGLRVYVPDELVEAYKTATNWIAFADKIKPMSELEE